MSNEIVLPSLQEIEQMEAKRQQAIESLKISGEYVKCQKCGTAVPIARGLARSRANTNRITTLQIRIKWVQDHYCPNIRDNKNDEIKVLKQELADLQAEDTKVDKLRSLPLYCCRITGWKFVCSKCYDRVYNNNMLLQRS